MYKLWLSSLPATVQPTQLQNEAAPPETPVPKFLPQPIPATTASEVSHTVWGSCCHYSTPQIR